MTGPNDADEAGDSTSDPAADHAELTIQQVSELLTVPAPTIRSWERRYGVPLADRSSGGHRRYSPAQLDELRRMRDLVAGGRRTAEAATLVKAGHSTSPGPLVHAFLQATRELAPDSIARTLDSARETLGLDRTIDEVLLPAMRQIGESWHVGQLDISHEHVATHATQAWLTAIRPPGPLRPQPPIVLSCGPRDHHTLGLESIAALLRQRGWDCRMLGARTPAEAMIRAVVDTEAAAFVLVCHVSPGRLEAVEALRSPGMQQRHVFYAGGAFGSPDARRNVPGHYLGESIAEAADLITTALTPGQPR